MKSFARAACGALLGLGVLAAAPAAAHDITVKIHRVTALDKIDLAGQADFYARVTIDGQVFQTARERRHDDLQPTNWVFTKTVSGSGKYDVKLEIYDKNVLSKDDMIDINRIDPKRDLDFKVSVGSGSCTIHGFAGAPKCGDVIVRAGGEKKRAELSFSVTAK